MKNEKIRRLVQLGMLVALLLIFSFTPLGYLRIGMVEITFNMIPVLIGAIVIGPGAGAILGGIFGITSFVQCFGTSAFGTLLYGVDPFFTIVLCFVPRILAGWIPGVVFRAFSKAGKTGIFSFGLSGFLGSFLNTSLFVGGFCLFFRDTMLGMAESEVLSPMAFIFTAFLINGLIEMGVCTVIVTAVTKTLDHIIKNRKVEYK